MPRLKEFHKPKTIADAIDILQREDLRIVPYAGGGKIVPALDGSIDGVLDLSLLGLEVIERQKDGWHLGTNVVLQQFVDHSELALFADGFLRQMALQSESYPQRQQTTLGGTLVSGRSSNPLLIAFLAMEVEVEARIGKDECQLLLPGFLDYRQKLLADKVLITGIRLPHLSEGMHFHFDAVRRTPSDQPIVCIVTGMAVKNGVVGHVRVAAGGAANAPVRLQSTEHRLERKQISAGLIEEAVNAGIQGLNPIGDYLGSAEYRKEMVRVLAARSLKKLAGLM